MNDPRIRALSRRIVTYSIAVQPGENILLESWDNAGPLAAALVEEIYRAGGTPVVVRESGELHRAQLMGLGEASARLLGELELERIRRMQGFVSIRGCENSRQYADVPAGRAALYSRATAQARRWRMHHTKWCALKYPGPAMAQQFGRSTAAFEDFYYRVLLLDYERMTLRCRPLEELAKRTDRVRILAADTDLAFSIKGCKGEPAFPNDTGNGRLNLPDGEMGCGVVKESVNGHIAYNLPTTYNGMGFSGVRFEIREGKIIKAECADPRRTPDLNRILDTDEGARYFGEFSIGVNPAIDEAVGDILFDEKMWGTLHVTPGHPPSAIHWDMVQSHKGPDGGGEIWFDGVLIRKDGYFLPEALRPLNPENLLPEIEYGEE